MATYTTTSGLNGGAYLTLTVTEVSQNIGGVTSTDSWSQTLYGGTRTSFDLTNTATWSTTINGSTTPGTFNYDFRPGPGTPAFCGSGTTSAISHNADGTKSISVSGSIGSLPSGTTGGPATAAGTFTQTPIGVTSGAIVSRLSHTLTQPREDLILAGTEAAYLTAVATLAPEITLATLPSSLSTAEVGAPSGGSTLDAFNEILDGEQGTIYSTVTGTLLAPVQSLTVRERTRPATITASWDIEREVEDAPEFVRDVTNLVSSVTVSGPTQSAVVIDQTLNARVGSANASESILNVNSVDLIGWGQDRLQRGANTRLRLASVTIDAMTTPTDRTADLLALTPGDRHRFTNLPSTQLGFSTWDGWLVGVDESHTLTEHKFTLYFQPVLSETGIFDQSSYMADGALTLSSSITSGATSMSVTTSNATVLLETVAFPYTLLIDSEQVTVTACTSAAPQVATITRGVNGTTAAAHSSGAGVEISGFVTLQNQILNPSPQVNDTGYSVQGTFATGARTAGVGVDGGYGYVVTWSSASTTATDAFRLAGGSTELTVPVTAGTAITPTAYVGSNRNALLTFRYGFYTSGNVLIGSFANDVAETQLVANYPLVRMVGTVIDVPATADHMSFRIVWATGTNWTTGSTLTVDRISLNPNPYFDGASADTDTLTHSWSGTAYASSSQQVSTAPAAALYAF